MKIETETYIDRGENWDSDAACAELMRGDPQTFDEYFYPDEFRDKAVTKMAIKICNMCPVKLECLNDALEFGDTWGVKGGTTPKQRQKLDIPRPRNAS